MGCPAASLGKHCYHTGFLCTLPATQVSMLGLFNICAPTARDHFSLLPVSEKFVQQHLWCFGETPGKGWLVVVPQAGWEAGAVCHPPGRGTEQLGCNKIITVRSYSVEIRRNFNDFGRRYQAMVSQSARLPQPADFADVGLLRLEAPRQLHDTVWLKGEINLSISFFFNFNTIALLQHYVRNMHGTSQGFCFSQ